MTTFVLPYEKISSPYQRAKIHNFCVSEEKNVAVGHSKTDKCQQINLSREIKRKPNELKLAEMVIEENREIIIQQWNTFFVDKKGSQR